MHFKAEKLKYTPRVVIWILIRLLAAISAVQTASAQHGWGWHQDDWPNTAFDMTSVKLEEIRGGGPPKDGIPSIDAPQFEDVATAAGWMEPLEPVIAVNINGAARAYPLKILIFHEIVNDRLKGVPISVTFCPLCNAAIVFDRRFQGAVLDFGTTGLLRMSDLVMYDRQTESWWQQFSGKSIVGWYLGSELTRIPSSIVSFKSFRDSGPGGLVLSRETGFQRPYGRNPYVGYDQIDQSPFLFDGKIDQRLPPMERVLTITVGAGNSKSNKLYPLTELKKAKLVNDEFASVALVVFAMGETLSVLDSPRIAGSKKLVEATVFRRRISKYDVPLRFGIDSQGIVDEQTGSHWNVLGKAIDGPLVNTQLLPVDSGVHFAFAWLAFNPDSEIYRANQN